jgi:hypothetical protein
MFYVEGDTDVKRITNDKFLYKGMPLTWGNTIPSIDKATRRKLAQTWRAHFLTKHGWANDDLRLPADCKKKL